MATKTKIRRSLFIGLGGTGMRTILKLKKLFIETYGEVPGMIGFLGVDTDRGEYSKDEELKNIASMGFIDDSEIYVEGQNKGNKVRLERNEQVQITVEHPQSLFKRNQDNYAWMPSNNNNALRSLTHGAGQVRTNGRFAFIANSESVEERVSMALTKVARASAVGEKYELIDNKTDVYIIFSLCGGTGCGVFIDMGYLVRRIAGDNCKLAGFGMLPEVFRANLTNGVDRVRPNAYGALMDLDWLMGRNLDDNPVKLPLEGGRTWSTSYTPFDACILVDNKNRNLDVYDETRQIEEMLALTLITSVGELSTANVSVLDNLAVDTTSGSFNVKGKKAWVSGMGVCEVIIRSDELRKIYAHMAAIHLVNQLLNKPADVNTEVMQWIDTVKIREHDADDVIDYLIDTKFTPLSGIDKSDYSDAMNVVTSFVNARQIDDEEVETRLQNLISRVSDELRTLVINSLKRSEGMGVGATEDLLQGIESEVRVYLKEMTNELEEQKTLEAQYDETVRTACKDLKEKAKGIFKIGVDDAKEEVCNFATYLAKTKREIARRVKAITFYNDLLTKIGAYQNRVREIRQRLEIVATNSRSEISKLRQNIARNTETFQINITSRVEPTISLDSHNILISDFITSLKEGNKIFDFSELETSTIGVRLLQHTYNLDRAKEIGNMDINDVLVLLKKNGLFEELVRNMAAKASPLLLHNFLGYIDKKPAINYYIGVNRFEDSLLKKDDYFKNNIEEVGDVNFSNIGMKDRIIVFSQMNPIPPFAIDSVSNKCKREYEDPENDICFHISTTILNEMKKTGYRLEPGNGDNALELWVKGFIFGLIKNDDGTYKYIDEENGDSLWDYWIDLGKYRDEAYKMFIERKSSIEDQFKKKIYNIISVNGLPYVQDIYTRAKEDYIENISQLGFSKEYLREHIKEYKGTVDLIREEIEFVKKQLDIH
ncbi:tubulin-like doman-containing protein [Xylanibacter ruminicola]|uniref:Tubulin like n=1 Tax=Xylanibacter ruminicola TaxID=839 RepID=A0A1M6UDZ9_XYLRU|nr:tubulin-like doman-containing protein [Xylanibacter ruminicola]SHK67465.1 Tubulin like [Xylanibacter ruminicola]